LSNVNPLQGVCVVLTRAPGNSAELFARLKSLGAVAMERPLIETKPLLKDFVAKSLSAQDDYGGVIVTSANAVRQAFVICQNYNTPWVLGNLRWYCIGKATAHAAETLGIAPIVFENVRNGQEFAKALARYFQGRVPGKLVFLHGQKADLSFVDVLQSAGIDAFPMLVYETFDALIDIHELHRLQRDGFVIYVFYSPSAIKSLIRQWPDFSLSRTNQTFVVAIGQTTSGACRRLGVLVDKVAVTPTSDALVDAIIGTVVQQKMNLDGGK
jgi:uroporphyrinogen-III synthase